MSVLWVCIAQHERAAVDVQMNVHRSALLIDGIARDFFCAECFDVEVRGLTRPIDREIRSQSAENRCGSGRLKFVDCCAHIVFLPGDARDSAAAMTAFGWKTHEECPIRHHEK